MLSESFMKKIVLAAATAGFFVALLDGGLWYYLYSHGLTETVGARLLAKIGRYAWPTAIMMMDADRVDFGTLFLFVSSAILNASVYGFVAFCAYLVWSTVFGRDRGDGWWPAP